MKDKARSIAAGMTEYKDDAAIEKQCRSCHNEKSPTSKEFNFQERWAKIRHSVPKNP
jgi:nitrate/TMAO reductase-like tetraheme cytochrome c subunit